MEIPREKNPASPITGKSTRPDGEAAPRREPPPKSPARAKQPAPEEEDADLNVDDEIFELPVISLPPRTAPKEPLKGVFPDLDPPKEEKAKEVEPRRPQKKILSRGSTDVAASFKRFAPRPETALAAHAAADQAKVENPVPIEKVDLGTPFGKIHPQSHPDYRPSRLFRVLDGIYTHSPLKWLDFVDRTGPRILAGLLLIAITGVFVAWRYLDSLKQRDTAVYAEQEVIVPTAERIEQGKKAVQAYLAAQTIDAKQLHVMDPDRAGPRMKEFYETQQGEDPKVMPGWEVGQPLTGQNGVWLPFTFQDSTGRRITVALAETETGCKLDWENFTAFGEANWQTYTSRRPITPTPLRVRLRLSENTQRPAGHPASDWQAYEIEHRSGGPVITGYAERSGRTGQTLASLIKPGTWYHAPLYLRYQTSEVSGERYVIMDDIVRNRWQDEVTSWTPP
jgi:hypothetical protein